MLMSETIDVEEEYDKIYRYCFYKLRRKPSFVFLQVTAITIGDRDLDIYIPLHVICVWMNGVLTKRSC